MINSFALVQIVTHKARLFIANTQRKSVRYVDTENLKSCSACARARACVHVCVSAGRAKNTPANLTFQWEVKCCCYCPRPVKNCLRCGAADVTDDEDDSDSSSSSSSDNKVQVYEIYSIYDILYDKTRALARTHAQIHALRL